MALQPDIVIRAADPQVEAVLRALPAEDHHPKRRIVAEVSDHRSRSTIDPGT